MSVVGIIANPASGKDIRRLVAYASVFDNTQKVNIVRRIILGLDSTGIEEVIIMPDTYGIGYRAIDGISNQRALSCKISFLDIDMRGTANDTFESARLIDEMGAGCLITLGGDGTNRIAAKSCGNVPLIPISTGTNNVFPYMIEGTVAGIAAGVIARKLSNASEGIKRAKKINIYKNGNLVDIALVDVVVGNNQHIGSRAVWKVDNLLQVIAIKAGPGNIGLSSIAGYFKPLTDETPGIMIAIGDSDKYVMAPISTGVIEKVPVKEYRLISYNQRIRIEEKPSILTLDGEREFKIGKDDNVEIEISEEGPFIVDVTAALNSAVKAGFFVSKNVPEMERKGIVKSG